MFYTNNNNVHYENTNGLIFNGSGVMELYTLTNLPCHCGMLPQTGSVLVTPLLWVVAVIIVNIFIVYVGMQKERQKYYEKLWKEKKVIHGWFDM